jgi:hypothetical protein
MRAVRARVYTFVVSGRRKIGQCIVIFLCAFGGWFASMAELLARTSRR